MNIAVWIRCRWRNRSRFVGNNGMSFVLGLVVICLGTCGGLFLLAYEANERIGARSGAQSVAFQAARSGAQRVLPRGRKDKTVQIDVPAAKDASIATMNALCVEYFPADDGESGGEDGGGPEFESAAHNCTITTMESIDENTGWQVSIEVQTFGGTVRALGIARPEVG